MSLRSTFGDLRPEVEMLISRDLSTLKAFRLLNAKSSEEAFFRVCFDTGLKLDNV